MAAISERTIANVRVRFYEPHPDAGDAGLIYLHGGGWTLFSIDTHDRLMREYASRAGLTVAGVDYPLSPESKFPLALEQIVAVARALRGHYARLAIGGDSAGANLAIGVAMQAPIFDALLLNYGVFERYSSNEARERFGGPGNMLTADEMEGFWRNYLRDERDVENPLVCPMRGDLRGLPPVLLVVAECDLLSEQSFHLAERLGEAGVGAELRLYRGAAHSFLEAVSISPLADRALEESSLWLRDRLAG